MKTRGRPRHPETLTPRQQEVLALLRQGLTNEEIAARLGITLDGAKFHVSEILLRLGVDSRYEAATWSPETAAPRGRWAFALAPLALLRKLRWNAAGIVAAGAAAAAIAVGIALLVFGLVRTNDDRAAARVGAADPAQVIFSTLAAGEQPTTRAHWTITVYDADAGRIAHQFDIGDGVNDQTLQVVAAGDRLVANLSDRIVRYDLDGSNPVELHHAAPGDPSRFDAPRILGIAASPDGTKIALAEQTMPQCPTPAPTEATPPICGEYAPITRVVVIATGDGKELMSVPQSDPRLAAYHGQLGVPSWRADGRSFFVAAYTYSEALGSTALFTLSGDVRILDSTDLLSISPGGEYIARGASTGTCGLGGVNDQHEITVDRLDDGTQVAHVSESDRSITAKDWAPNGSALLYRSVVLADDPANPQCQGEDASTEQWFLLPVDGSAPTPVASAEAVHKRWYGDRTVEYRCGDAPAEVGAYVPSCSNSDGTALRVQILIGGKQVATAQGGGSDFQLIQQIPPDTSG